MTKIDEVIARVEDLRQNTLKISDHVVSTESNTALVRDTMSGKSLLTPHWPGHVYMTEYFFRTGSSTRNRGEGSV